MGVSFKMKGLVVPMSARAKSLMLVSALALVAVEPASAQVKTGLATQVARPAPVAARSTAPASRTPAKPETAATGAPVPGNPDYAPQAGQAVPPPPPPPLPPPVWDLVSAQDLLYYIQQIGKEGLSPADYDPAGLVAAIKTGDALVVSKEATDRFDRVSSDLALGHVKRSARTDWFVADPDLDAAKQDALLRSALAQHNVT